MVTASYFDGTSTQTVYDDLGLPLSVTEGTNTTTYAYDNMNRPSAVTQPNGQISYTYDLNGNRTSMTTPAGTTTYAYDARQLLTSITDLNNETTTFSYNVVGNLVTRTLPNGVISTHTYDQRDRLLSLEHHTGVSVLASYDYTLDNVGNRLAVEEADGGRITWAYDDAYRLISETRYSVSDVAIYNAAWVYDATNNRLSQTEDSVTTTYTYDELDQITQSVQDGETTTYTYDGRGNLISQSDSLTSTTYTWDARDRLVGVGRADVAAAYTYDHTNNRVQTVVNGDTTTYLWDELSAYGDVVLEQNATGDTAYTLAGMQLISQTDTEINYFLSDGQNSTRALIDPTGVLTQTYDYTAYGELYNAPAELQTRYLYTGQQFDAEIGQYSLRARHYNPSQGRFLSRDSYPYNYQNPVELNRYGYTAGNPINDAVGEPVTKR